MKVGKLDSDVALRRIPARSLEVFRSEVWGYWEKEGRHHLPWRKTTDPYRILVSEVMLQQTQVDRVIPYYERWLKKFPTVRALAKAPLAAVLQEWSGLGYNNRGKNLRECAKEIVKTHDGKVPTSRESLINLPAIGPYTAGAIRAFAFDEKEVFIETNIRAALIHHFFPKAKKVPDTKLIPILEKLLVHVKSSREWYAALMDYGAYIKKTTENPSRRSAHHVKQSPFEGSLRQLRGKLLRALIKGPVSLTSFKKIGARNSYMISMALRGMEEEGLIMRRGKKWYLLD